MAEDNDAYSADTTDLDRLVRIFKEKPPQVRIGIFGTSKRVDGKDNATVGAAHEFGTSQMPMRSFLRMPLAEKLPGALENSRLFNEDALKELLKSGNLKPWMRKLASIGKKIVLEAFDTAGFGKWAAWAPGYSNKYGTILKDTQQLKNAVTSDVK